MFKGRKSGRTSAKDAVLALAIHRLRHQEIGPFSLTIKQGEIFGFVGPTGSGKSTIIDLLSARKTPQDGAISIMGCDDQCFEYQGRKFVGVMPQADLNTLGESGTPVEHLHFHARLIGMSQRSAHERIPLVLTHVRLARYEHLQVSAFSSALKQRLALARALVHDPRLLLLDEPTRDMERQERVALWDLLFALRTQGKTILLTTQDWEEACTLCDRVAHLSQGKLRAGGEQAFWAKSEHLLRE